MAPGLLFLLLMADIWLPALCVVQQMSKPKWSFSFPYKSSPYRSRSKRPSLSGRSSLSSSDALSIDQSLLCFRVFRSQVFTWHFYQLNWRIGFSQTVLLDLVYQTYGETKQPGRHTSRMCHWAEAFTATLSNNCRNTPIFGVVFPHNIMERHRAAGLCEKAKKKNTSWWNEFYWK